VPVRAYWEYSISKKLWPLFQKATLVAFTLGSVAAWNEQKTSNPMQICLQALLPWMPELAPNLEALRIGELLEIDSTVGVTAIGRRTSERPPTILRVKSPGLIGAGSRAFPVRIF